MGIIIVKVVILSFILMNMFVNIGKNWRVNRI